MSVEPVKCSICGEETTNAVMKDVFQGMSYAERPICQRCQSLIADKKCPEPECKEWPLTFENTDERGEGFRPTRETIAKERHDIYRCGGCGATYRIKKD